VTTTQAQALGLAVLFSAISAVAWQFAARHRQAVKRQQSAQFKRRLDAQLIDAVLRGNADSVRGLLQRGADANTRVPPAGASALMVAAHYGRLDIATMLLDHGADLNARGQIVIPEGVDPSILDLDHHVTPLIEAVWTLNEPMTRLLLERGADPAVRDSEEVTALGWAENLIPTTSPETSAPRLRRLDPILKLLRDAKGPPRHPVNLDR